MEHFIRIAFWIFTLLFTLSGCKSMPIPEDFDFDFLKKNVICPKDTKLYSPKDVMPKCFISALECVFNELYRTAKDECTDEGKWIEQDVDTLQELIGKMKVETGSVSTASKECACEKWDEVPFDEFLNNYKTLIQLIEAERIARETSR